LNYAVIASNDYITVKKGTGKGKKGSGNNLVKVLSHYFPQRNEENHETPQSGQPVSWSRFALEPPNPNTLSEFLN